MALTAAPNPASSAGQASANRVRCAQPSVSSPRSTRTNRAANSRSPFTNTNSRTRNADAHAGVETSSLRPSFSLYAAGNRWRCRVGKCFGLAPRTTPVPRAEKAFILRGDFPAQVLAHGAPTNNVFVFFYTFFACRPGGGGVIFLQFENALPPFPGSAGRPAAL